MESERVPTEPAVLPISDSTVYIMLGNKNWPVPLLAPRQLRVIVPRVYKVTRHTTKDGRPTAPQDLELSAELYDLGLEIIHAGLTRAHPKMTFEELLDMPMSVSQVNTAMIAVVQQSGMFKVAEPGETPSGETKAESPPTGTE